MRQETYLLAFGAFADFRHDIKVSTWLMRIAVNAATARLRKLVRRAAILAQRYDMRCANEAERDVEQPDEVLLRRDRRRLFESPIDA